MIDKEEFDKQMSDHILSDEEMEEVVEKATAEDPRDLGIILSGFIFEESVNSIDAMITLLRNMKSMFNTMADMLAEYYIDAGWSDTSVVKPKPGDEVLCIAQFTDSDEDGTETEIWRYAIGEWLPELDEEFNPEYPAWNIGIGYPLRENEVPFWRRLPKPPEMYEEDE